MHVDSSWVVIKITYQKVLFPVQSARHAGPGPGTGTKGNNLSLICGLAKFDSFRNGFNFSGLTNTERKNNQKKEFDMRLSRT